MNPETTECERIFNQLNIIDIVRDLKYVEYGMDFVRFKLKDTGEVFEIRVAKTRKK